MEIKSFFHAAFFEKEPSLSDSSLSPSMLTYPPMGNARSEYKVPDFSDFLFDDYNIEEELINGELVKALNEFIYSLPKIQQSIFVKRYYYSQSIESIACDDNISSWQVKKNIIDIKKKLRDNLISKELI